MIISRPDEVNAAALSAQKEVRVLIDKKFIGKKYFGSDSYDVSRMKIKEYASSLGDLNPLYVDRKAAEAGEFKRIVAPPTFAVVYGGEPAGMMLFDPELKLNLPMLVHGEQEIEFSEVVGAGDELTSVGEITEIYQKKNLDFISITVESKNQRGMLAARAKYTFVVRGAAS
jgi:acyl dehydratase